MTGTLVRPVFVVAVCTLAACGPSPSSPAPSVTSTPIGAAAQARETIAQPLTADERALERARMQRHIDSLYSRDDVVHSFKLANADDIDCVRIERQPGLRGARMAVADIPKQPRSMPVALTKAPPSAALAAEVGVPGGKDSAGKVRTCPPDTIPIRRLTLETLERFGRLEAFFGKGAAPVKPPGSGSNHEYAHAARSIENMGAESVINLWQQFVYPEGEFSLSQIWVARGSDSNLETVEVGVQHYKDLYGNDQPRLFIYFTPDNYGSGGCYNLSCSGFVQVNGTAIIGGPFTWYSQTDSAQAEMRVMWFKDGDDGAWWLRYYDTWIGYYPRSKFDENGLATKSDYIDFGGEIVNTAVPGVSAHTATDMGSGRKSSAGWQKAAYQKRIVYVQRGTNTELDPGTLAVGISRPECYDLTQASDPGNWERYFFFGGEGYFWQVCM